MPELPIGEIICGDCLDVMRGWPDKCVDAVITDPPYGISLTAIKGHAVPFGKTGRAYMGWTDNYDKPAQGWDDSPLSNEHIAECQRVSKFQSYFGANYFNHLLPSGKQWIVWDKCVPDGMAHSQVELIWTSAEGADRIVRATWSGCTRIENNTAKVHPAQKPVALMEWLINKFTRPGDLILDPFCGSGSTLTAAERLGRRWIGIDISEQYCAIARKRTAQKGLPL